MGLRVKTNMESLIAQRRISENRRAFGDSLEKLSSGQRINKSADDAAGLAVSERMRATTRSLEVSKRNANDGISYIQTAEGSLNEVTNIIVRMRELTAQAASDTLGNKERSYLDKEFQQMRQEVQRIVDTTEFNGSKILQSQEKPIQIFVGASNRANDFEGNAPEIADPDPDVISIDLSDLGKMTEAVGKLTMEEGLAIVPPGMEGGAQELGETGTADLFNRLDTALDSIAGYRATLGSVQSRLNSAINNIEVSTENLNAANSRIRDVDFASPKAAF